MDPTSAARFLIPEQPTGTRDPAKRRGTRQGISELRAKLAIFETNGGDKFVGIWSNPHLDFAATLSSDRALGLVFPHWQRHHRVSDGKSDVPSDTADPPRSA